MLMVNKAFLGWHIFTITGATLIALAIFFGARGDTLNEAKAALKADYEHAVIQANYTILFNDNYGTSALAKFLPKVFNNQVNRYFIRYPANWEYATSNKTMVVLNGKVGTPAYFSNINIQTLRAQKIGGPFTTVPQVITGLKKQVDKTYSNVRYVEQGPITLKQLNGTQLHGEYVIFTYSNGGLAFKQWQVIILRNDGLVFYVFAYNSPLVQYQTFLATAEAMLASWDIY